MTVTTIYSDAADDWIQSQDVVYATCRAGGGSTGVGGGAVLSIGQWDPSTFGFYLCYESFISFDTSVVGAGQEVTQAQLGLYGTFDGSVTDYTIEARVDDWGASVTTGDWVPGADLGALRRVATFATSGWSTAGYNTFTEDGGNFRSEINVTGSTRLILVTDRLVAGTAPTTVELVQASSADAAGTTQDPKLVVTHAAYPTISLDDEVADAVSRERSWAVRAVQRMLQSARDAVGTVEVIPVHGVVPTRVTGGIRVDVYDGSGTKLDVGPVVEVTAMEYGEAVDREGSFSLTIPATAYGADGLEVGQRLRVYREGEGQIPVIGIIETLEWAPGVDGGAALAVSGPSLSHELAWVNTGVNRVLTARTPAQVVSDLLTGTGWTAGSVDTSAVTLSRRYDGASVSAALLDAARFFGFHVRFNDLAKTVDFGALGRVTGQCFANMEAVPQLAAGQEVLPITAMQVRESSAELWNRVIVLGGGDGWGRATMLVWPYESVGLIYTGKVANGNWPVSAHHDAQNFEDPGNLGGWGATGATIARSTVDPYDGDGCMLITSTSAVGWSVIDTTWNYPTYWTGVGALAGHTVKFRFMVQGRGTAVGKRIEAQLVATPSNNPNVSTVITLTSAWQLVELEAVFQSGSDTTAAVGLSSYDAPAVGDAIAVDRAALWDATVLQYPPEHAVAADGIETHYVEDLASAIEHGRRVRTIVIGDIYPAAGTYAAHRSASAALARQGSAYLARHKDPVTAVSFETTGLTLGLAYPVPVGDRVHVRYAGVASDGYAGSRRAFATVNSDIYLLSYRRRLGGNGEDAWSIDGASVDEYLQAFEDQFVEVQSTVQNLEQQADSGRGISTWSAPDQTVTAGASVGVLVETNTDQMRYFRSLTVAFRFMSGPNSATIHLNGTDITASLSGGPFNGAGTTYTVDLTPYVCPFAPVPYSDWYFISVRMPTTTSVVALTVTAEYATGLLD